MLAENHNYRDADFSHLKIIISAIEPEKPVRYSARYIYWGVLISLALHGALFFWIPAPTPQLQTPQILKLTLVKSEMVQPLSSEPVQAIESLLTKPKPFPTDAIATERSEKKIIQKTHQQPKEKPINIEPLSPAELREITHHEKQVEQSFSGSISENVFNPQLATRLIDEENKPDLRRAEIAPKTYTDPSGATVVDLGGGKCLRSSVAKPGEVQDWYMTACGGKSESEQIMERVNQAVNGKLRFK